MNMKKILSALLLLAGNAGLLSTQAISATLPEKVLLYRFEETKPFTVDDSVAYMKQFMADDATDRLVPSIDNIVRYVSPKDPNTTFEHNLLTGDLRFHRNFARYLGDYKPALPTTEEAVNAAVVFLEENKLLPAVKTELKIAHIGGLRATSFISGKRSGPVIDKLITLNYAREIDGLPVIGPGSKMVIDIGEKAEIISLTRHWRELSPKSTELSPSELFTLTDANRLLKKLILTEFGDKAKFETLQTHMAYFDNNGPTLQPVFAFQTKVFLPDQQAASFDYMGIVPAMRKSPEALNLTKTNPLALRAIQNADTTLPGGSTKRPD